MSRVRTALRFVLETAESILHVAVGVAAGVLLAVAALHYVAPGVLGIATDERTAREAGIVVTQEDEADFRCERGAHGVLRCAVYRVTP